MSLMKSYIPELPRFSRKWWLGGARNFLWVAVITLLIWIYADVEFTEEREFRGVTIKLNTGQSDNLILMSDSEVDVTFYLRGSLNSLERFRTKLNNAGSVIQYDVSQQFAAGQESVPIKDILHEALGISKDGLSFESSSPNMILIQLNRKIRIDPLPVRFKYTGATLLEAEKVEPPRVAVRVAESLWQKVMKAQPDPASRRLVTRTVNLENTAANEPTTIEAEIIPSIAGVAVEPEQATVKVTFRISQRTARKALIITVFMQSPPEWYIDGTWEKYKPVWKTPLEWRKEITVSGSKKDIDRLKAKDIGAYVKLREEDKEGSWWTGTVQVHLPEGLQVQIVGEKPKVQYKLELRQPAAP